MNERLLAVLNSAAGFDGVLITCENERRYLTSFDSGDAGVLVITQNAATLIIDGPLLSLNL